MPAWPRFGEFSNLDQLAYPVPQGVNFSVMQYSLEVFGQMTVEFLTQILQVCPQCIRNGITGIIPDDSAYLGMSMEAYTMVDSP